MSSSPSLSFKSELDSRAELRVSLLSQSENGGADWKAKKKPSPKISHVVYFESTCLLAA